MTQQAYRYSFNSLPGIIVIFFFFFCLQFALPFNVMASDGLSSESPPHFLLTESHHYEEKTGDTIKEYNWTMSKIQENCKITIDEPEEQHALITDPTGKTQSWMLKKKNTDITAYHDGTSIQISGKHEEKNIKKSYALDNSPWFQYLSLSLRLSLQTLEQNDLTFWLIRPDTFECNKMKATFKNEQTITTYDGKETLASVIDVRLTGWKSTFWHGTYWFRKSDGLFLKYESVNGPPGSPLTTVIWKGSRQAKPPSFDD